MMRIVILIHEVSGIFKYVVVYGTNEEYLQLHHIIASCAFLL